MSLAAALAGAAACASNPIKPGDQALIAKADAQLLVGCYTCLHEAHDTYARLAVAKARPLLVTKLFESDLLLTLRAKELALDPTPAFAEATALAKEQPASIGADHALAIVAAVAPDDVGTTQRAMQTFYGAQQKYLGSVDADLAWLHDPTVGVAPAANAKPVKPKKNAPPIPELREPVLQYLAMALDCSYPARPHPSPFTRWWVGRDHSAFRTPLPGAAPLVRYRAGTCTNVDVQALMALHDEVPAYTEIAYFLARPAVGAAKDTGPGTARALLKEAYAAFPKSPSVTYLDGNFNQLLGDCKAALGRYDETLALATDHENALLGRTVCLSFLKRNDEAIQSATHMIDVKADVPDAYYWRAWNQHFLTHLPEARADIEQAKKMTSQNGDVLTLAGIIEHDQDDLPPAETDLTKARGIPFGKSNCVAAWYLGLVRLKQERWLDSGTQFEAAMDCYATHVAQDKDGLDRMTARTDLDPDFRAAQIKGFQAALEEDQSQQYAAAFNAANNDARGGNVDRARTLLPIAAKDPGLADKVEQLKKIIGDGSSVMGDGNRRWMVGDGDRRSRYR
jgi:tetratricopeptide (TPR) repeat protein